MRVVADGETSHSDTTGLAESRARGNRRRSARWWMGAAAAAALILGPFAIASTDVPERLGIRGRDFLSGEMTQGIPESVLPQASLASVGAAWSPEEGVLWVFTDSDPSCFYVSAETIGVNPYLWLSLTRRHPTAQPPSCSAETGMYTTKIVVKDGFDVGVPLWVDFTPERSNEDYEEWFEPVRVQLQPREKPGATGPAAWAPPWPNSLRGWRFTPSDGWPGIPSYFTPPPDGPAATRLLAGASFVASQNILYVVTWGSSSCPQSLDGFDMDSAGQIDVSFRHDTSAACSGDWAPTTWLCPFGSTFREWWKTGEPLTVRFDDFGSVTIQPDGPGLNSDMVWLFDLEPA